MSRIRTIKPEFWASAQVVECSPIARLLFIGLWNFCDDEGRMSISLRQIKLQIFPGDDLGIAEVRRMLDELSSNRLIELYVLDGEEFLQVTGWHHQKIDRATPSRFPANNGQASTSIRRGLDESARSARAQDLPTVGREVSIPTSRPKEGSTRMPRADAREGKDKSLDGAASLASPPGSGSLRGATGEKQGEKQVEARDPPGTPHWGDKTFDGKRALRELADELRAGPPRAAPKLPADNLAPVAQPEAAPRSEGEMDRVAQGFRELAAELAANNALQRIGDAARAKPVAFAGKFRAPDAPRPPETPEQVEARLLAESVKSPGKLSPAAQKLVFGAKCPPE